VSLEMLRGVGLRMAIGVTAFKVLCAAGLLVCDCDVGDAVAGD